MKCEGIAGKLFGHKYQNIFNEEKKYTGTEESIRTINESVNFTMMLMKTTMPEILDSMSEEKKTYVHSICSRCGDTIKKDK